MWGLFKVPELEATHFKNDDVVFGNVIEGFDAGDADVADEPNCA